MDTKTQKEMLIAECKLAKEVTGLSYKSIADRTEANGEAVSASTIRRVLTGELPPESCRNEDILKPIARALEVIETEPESTEDVSYKQLLNAAVRQLDIAQQDFHTKDKIIHRQWVIIVLLLFVALLGFAVDLLDIDWSLVFKG
jgi:hypothetical protein